MKFIKQYLYAIIFLGLIINNSYISAQKSLIITGKVISATDSQPLTGATVVEMDKTRRYIGGTITDINGNFALKISSSNNIIVVSFIGFRGQEFPATTSNINAVLEEDKVTVKQVDIVARANSSISSNGFISVDDRDNVASVKKISTKDLEDLPSASIDDALQGRIAGLDIVSISGDPGAGSTIRIRNASSLSGSTDPLIVIDGIPNETKIDDAFSLSSATSENFGQLLNISPDDISDISVLTDAASTAVYGSQASNGVILIKTKRGMRGKVSVNYTYRGTLNFQPKQLPMLNGDQYATLIPEGYMNFSDTPMDVNSAIEFKNDPTDPNYYNFNKNTNWIDLITQVGRTDDHNLSFTGGGDKATYRFSVTYYDQTGTTKGTGMQRLTTSLNIDYNISEKMTVQADIRYSHIDRDNNFLPDGKSGYSVRSVAYRKMPNMSVYQYFGGIETENYFTPEETKQGTFPGDYNPVAMVDRANDNNIQDVIMPTFRLNYKFTPDLVYSFDVRFTVKNSLTSSFLPQEATGSKTYSYYTNNTFDSENQSYDIYTRNSLSFSKKFSDKHKLSSVLAVTTSSGNGYSYGLDGINTASSELQFVSSSSRITNIRSGKPDYKTYASVFSTNYSLLDRYILNVSLRGEADPKFGDNYMYGLFGGAGLRWRISGENFMKPLKFINDLSLRANWGINGNSGITPSHGKYAQYNAYNFSYMEGLRGVYPNNLELKNFRWEKKIQPNIGLSAEMFDNRFSFDINFWQDKVKDGFRKGMPLPSSSGFPNVDVNLLEAHNQGIDLVVNAKVYKSDKLTIDLRMNHSTSQFIPDNISARYNNEITWPTPTNGMYLYNPRDKTPLGSVYGLRSLGVYKDREATIAIDESGNKIFDAKGLPVYMTYDYQNTRYVFQPGDAMYEDVNHDGNINYNDVVYLGNSNPTLTGGFGSSIRYKQFYMDVYFYYRYNYLIINETKYSVENMTDYDNQSTAVLRRWRKEGDVTDIPRAVLGNNYNSIGSDRFTEDGSFLRLKTLTLGYNLNKKMLEKMRLKNARLYMTITNPLTYTHYSGQDPEVSIDDKGEMLVAIDNARTPRSKDVTIGLNIGF